MSVQSIGIKIWGDLKDLTTALSKGTSDVQGFTKGTEGAFKNLYATVKQGEANIRNLTAEFGKHSAQVKEASKQLEPFRQRLSDANAAAKGSHSIFGEVRSELTGMIAGYVGVGVAIEGAIELFKGAIEGALQEEAATKKLKFALNDSATATERMLRFKEQMMSSTLFSEDDIMGAVNMGLELGRTENETKKMINAAMGLANVTGTDLNTAMLQLSGTYEGNIGKLGKLAGELKNLTADQLANGAAIDVINAKYGKFATEGLDSMEGKVKQMKKYWGEALETIGVKAMDVFEAFRIGFSQWGTYLSGKTLSQGAALQKSDDSRNKQFADHQAKMDSINAEIENNKRLLGINLAVQKGQENQVKSTKDLADAESYRYEQLLRFIKAEKDGLLGPKMPTNMGEMTQNQYGGELGTGKLTPKSAGSVMTGNNRTLFTQAGGGTGALDKSIKSMDMLRSSIAATTDALGVLGSNFQNLFANLGETIIKFKEGFNGNWKDMASTIGNTMSSAVSFVSGLFQQQTDNRIAQLDQQTEAHRESIQNSRMSEESKKKALDKLDKDTAKQKKALLREQAKDNKEASIVQALIAGALGVIQATNAPPPLDIILPILVGALTAVQIAAIISQPLPALAMGGLAYGPTLAQIGEYPGASSNPEVIAPLDKLKGMLNSGNEGGGVLTATVRGDDLKFILDRANVRAKRIGS